MLQVDLRHYASDALEDAMRLAQTKALNSFTFSDCLAHLNYAWSDIYSKIACIDDGYYGINVRLTDTFTKLPAFVKSSVMIYSAQSPRGFKRLVYREAGTTDMDAPGTYKISGNELFCADAKRNTVWLYYVPACPQIFFTHHNRDPKLWEDGHATIRNNLFNIYKIYGEYTEGGEIKQVDITTCDREQLMKIKKWYKLHIPSDTVEDITDTFIAEQNDDSSHWVITYLSCDYPYIFVTYEHEITHEHLSGFFDKDLQFVEYNPFAFTGRNSNVEYVSCKWNDKTGLGVIIKDYNDLDELGEPRVKELGWTPDTQLDYPAPEMYRYLVARLADKFAALNESDVMGVKKELIEAERAFNAFIDKDKSAWKRIINVNPPTIGDWL